MNERTTDSLSEEDREAIESLVASNPAVTASVEEAVAAFLDECERFDTVLRDGTPRTVIRRIALHQTERRLSKDG